MNVDAGNMNAIFALSICFGIIGGVALAGIIWLGLWLKDKRNA